MHLTCLKLESFTIQKWTWTIWSFYFYFRSWKDSTFCNLSLYERLWSLCLLWYRIKLPYLPTFTAWRTFSVHFTSYIQNHFFFLKTDKCEICTRMKQCFDVNSRFKTRLLLHALKNTITSIEKTVQKFLTDETWCNSFIYGSNLRFIQSLFTLSIYYTAF